MIYNLCLQFLINNNGLFSKWCFDSVEAVAQTCSVKKVFLEISQNPQENTCAKVSFLIKLQSLGQVLSCEFCEISKNTFFYRTPLVATSTQMTLELVVILMFKQSPKMNSKSK